MLSNRSGIIIFSVATREALIFGAICEPRMGYVCHRISLQYLKKNRYVKESKAVLMTSL